MGLYQEFNKLADMCYLDKIEFEPEEQQEEIQDQEQRWGERRKYD